MAIQKSRPFEKAHAEGQRPGGILHRLLELQETERLYLAVELHDQIGQGLSAAKINLMAAVQHAPGGSLLVQLLQESIAMLDTTLDQVRDLSFELRPALLDDVGLVAALRCYLDSQCQRAGLAARFSCDPIERRFPPDVETECFRVAQEAVTNAVSHARAQKVEVGLHFRETELHLIIHDDGVGFDVQSALQQAVRGASFGLLGMRVRVRRSGGRIDIKSAAGSGTEIQAFFPLRLRFQTQG